MVCDGLGLTWAPDWLGLDDLRRGRIVEVMRAARVAAVPLSTIRLDRRLAPQRIEIVLARIEAEAASWVQG